MPGLWNPRRTLRRIFGYRKDHAAEVLDLRGVVVAAAIEEVYTIKRKLGEGQTAMVYEGLRLADGKTYALKAFRLSDGLRAACEGLRDEVEKRLPLHSVVLGEERRAKRLDPLGGVGRERAADGPRHRLTRWRSEGRWGKRR